MCSLLQIFPNTLPLFRTCVLFGSFSRVFIRYIQNTESVKWECDDNHSSDSEQGYKNTQWANRYRSVHTKYMHNTNNTHTHTGYSHFPHAHHKMCKINLWQNGRMADWIKLNQSKFFASIVLPMYTQYKYTHTGNRLNDNGMEWEPSSHPTWQASGGLVCEVKTDFITLWKSSVLGAHTHTHTVAGQWDGIAAVYVW